jgi:hypothetical protein
LQNHLQPIFDFEFGSNGVVPIVAELGSNLHLFFARYGFKTRFKMQPIQWMRVKMQSYFSSTTLHYLEYNRTTFSSIISPVGGVNVIVDVIVKSVDKTQHDPLCILNLNLFVRFCSVF